MKAFTTTSALLGLLSTPATATEPVKAQAEVSLGDVTFRLSRFNDGRSTPYRIYFWDKHITGSSYRFSQSGHLEYFKAGDEVYYDRTEKESRSLVYKTKEAKDSGDRHEDKVPMTSGDFTCDDCVADLAAVCGTGLPDFCADVDESYLGRAGVYSVGILCHYAETLCSTSQDGCDAICLSELEQSELVRDQQPPCLEYNVTVFTSVYVAICPFRYTMACTQGVAHPSACHIKMTATHAKTHCFGLRQIHDG